MMFAVALGSTLRCKICEREREVVSAVLCLLRRVGDLLHQCIDCAIEDG